MMREGWVMKKLGDICAINPKKPDLSDDIQVTFLGMASVEAESGAFDATDSRKYADVKKGYTGFTDGDVIFAKITPCMENGKVALVNRLRNSVGIGSTEFHVLRPSEQIEGKYLFHFIIQRKFRSAARQSMTGSAGQLRVPKSFLEDVLIPLPPLETQKTIVAKIEELFSELDNGIANLQEARRKIDIYRQSVLKKAFEGELTKDWRSRQSNLPTGEELLAQIQAERQRHYEQQLADWKSAVKAWEKNGKKGRKPGKPNLPSKFSEPHNISETKNFHIPSEWKLAYHGTLIEKPQYGTSKKCSYECEGTGVLRIPNIQNGVVNSSDLKFAEFANEEIINYHLHKGDLLTIRSNGSIDLVGKCALVSENDEKYLYAGYLIRLRPYHHLVLGKFLLYCLQTVMLRNQIEMKAKSTSGVNNINTGELTSLVIPYCSVQEQTQIIQEIESRLSVCDKLTETIDTSLKQAEAMRQSILKKAFDGKLL